ncbi:hypothetical protein ACFE04_022020 [Oxalis oulophora]
MQESRGIGILGVVVIVLIAFGTQTCVSQIINRSSFPKGFVFGTASSAFQYEGAVKVDGRGPTVWDKFSHTFGKITDFSNADVAEDHYHRYAEDIQLMKDMGVDVFRFSIAWSRIYPNGTGQINQAGIDHYNNVINALLAQGYDVGLQAPGRCSIILHLFCPAGNSATEPYTVGHNVLLSHATVADIYRRKYKQKQHGSLGIAFDVIWYEPASNSEEDIAATQRAQDFQLGWFLDPLMFGDYPNSMRTRVGNRLPTFTESQSSLLKGSLDFVGINHYTTFYAKHNSTNIIHVLLNDTYADSGAITLPFKDGKPIADRANSIWLYIVPEGMRSLMNYIKQKYGNPLVLITENGMDDGNNPFKSVKDALKDEKRINYYNSYLTNLLAAIKEDGCNVKGYFAWSLLDNWEWAAGYSSRFGLYYVDYKDNLKRYPKDSARWFKKFLSS